MKNSAFQRPGSYKMADSGRGVPEFVFFTFLAVLSNEADYFF